MKGCRKLRKRSKGDVLADKARSGGSKVQGIKKDDQCLESRE